MFNKAFPLSRQIPANIALVILGATIKTIYIATYYDKTTGLFETGFMPSFLNLIFYVILALLVAVNFLMATGVAVSFKHLKHGEPVVVGYALFFTAVMFVVEGLFGFYSHFVTLVDSRINSQAALPPLGIMGTITTFLPFINDLICLICAFAFYKMAMESFCDEGEPQQSLAISAIPVVWAIISLFNVLIKTNVAIFIQSDFSQIILCIFTLAFLYFIMESFIFPQKRRRQSIFTLLVRFSYASISLTLVVPYLLVRIFSITDHVQIMPYFALLGTSVYGFISMFNFTFTANALQRKKR